MEFIKATIADLPKINTIYAELVKKIENDGMNFWNEEYPFCFLEQDILEESLYLLKDRGEIISCIKISSERSESKGIEWAETDKKIIYFYRFGVNVKYLNNGLGFKTIECAKKVAKEMGGECIRFLVVRDNTPAINLYIKNGFTKVPGMYTEVIDENYTFHEYGFELMI